MENKKNYLTRSLVCLILIAMLVGCIALCSAPKVASASTVDQTPDAEINGLVTNITVTIGVNGGRVYAKAHNKFTLGSSTIKVYLYLYSSLTYQDDCSNMTLVNQRYIADLNIYKSIEISSETGGVQKYWKAKVYYQMDDKSPVTKVTDTVLVSADGTSVG